MSKTGKKILISASVFDGPGLWTNGLNQNCLFLYKLFLIGGYDPIFVVNNIPDSENTKQYKFITIQMFVSKPFPVYALIEMALKFNYVQRKIFKNKGAKLFKLFLGNILNIDIEMPTLTTQDFVHHLPEHHGTMLNSPHHYFTQEYTSTLYNVYPNSKIGPYVWDSVFIQDLFDIYKWPSQGPYSFTIMEPNISFIKCSLVPIMICEAFYREKPGVLDGVIVINGTKLTQSQYFLTNILVNLDLYTYKKMFLIQRMTVRDVSTKFKQNIIIHHAVNNDYNYLFLEYLFMGFPVIHNYEMLKDYGYYYKGNDIEAGKNMIEHVINNHGSNLEAYKCACRQLYWKFSIYNPDNIKGWQNIFDK